MYPKVLLQKASAKHVMSGHPWIFSRALQGMPKLKSGDLCTIISGGQFVGIGYYNADTDIAVRILTRKEEKIDTSFFEQRLKAIDAQKRPWLAHTNAYRAVFGESDGLPGLIVDRYVDTLVVQCHTVGMERLVQQFLPALVSVYKPSCVYQRHALHSDRIEGKPATDAKVLYGKIPEELIMEEHGFKFYVDIVRGQKTGFFLDQRENRRRLVEYAKGRRVVNCFSYTGGFSVYAASVAKQVTSVDISKGAIADAERNFLLNGFDPKKHRFLVADVFDYLKEIRRGEFDLIILDPPSFARKRMQVPQAIKAYTTINSKALEKLESGGILVSSSCTAHIDELTFIKILHQSSVNTKCTLKVLESAVQPIDHAYNLHFPEGRYLKFVVMVKE